MEGLAQNETEVIAENREGSTEVTADADWALAAVNKYPLKSGDATMHLFAFY